MLLREYQLSVGFAKNHVLTSIPSFNFLKIHLNSGKSPPEACFIILKLGEKKSAKVKNPKKYKKGKYMTAKKLTVLL